MSAKDLSARLFAPAIALPRRPLSSKLSTASCNMRFSLRVMISGARNSNKRFKRLLRLITRRYKSFKSDVAKRPPSNGTNGRKSGGNTGNTSITIHSGRMPERWNASRIFKRLAIFLIFASDDVACNSARKRSMSAGVSKFCNNSRMPSAPINARNSSPYSSVLA